MDILNNYNEIGNQLFNKIDFEKIQNDFLNSKIGQVANIAIDVGLKALLPDFVENEVIDVKNSLLEGGLKEGIDKAIENTIQLGKKALGLSNKDFNSIEQAMEAVKKGDLASALSNSMDVVVNKLANTKLISRDIANAIKDGKNVILDKVDKGTKNEFENELKELNKIENHIDKWEKCYINKDIKGLNKEFNKIEKIKEKILPLENIINNINKIENLNNLINNSDNFDFDTIYLDLANNL